MSLSANAMEYLDHLRSRGRKETTLEGYRASIKVCESCLIDGGFSVKPDDVDEEAMYYLRDHLHLKETTMQIRIRAYAQYIEWSTGRNPSKRAKLLWNPMTYDVVRIDTEEYNQLLSFCFSLPHIRMILLLGGLMGLRRTEIASIKLQDIHSDRITIHGKGHGSEGNVKDQHIPKEMIPEIRHYLLWRKEKLDKDNIVTDDFIIFVERYGHVSLPKYRNAAISWAFAKISEDTGIHVTPHSLRRLFATTLYADGKGVDINTIAKLMRHSNPNVTWRYIKQNDDSVTKASDSIIGSMGVCLNNGSNIYKYQTSLFSL